MTTHLNENISHKETMVIVLLDGPYISQYADIGYKMAESALKLGYGVKIFLYTNQRKGFIFMRSKFSKVADG